MLRAPARLRFALAAAALSGATAVGCSSSTDPSSIAGTYQATTLRVSSSTSGSLDALAGGVTMSLTISSSNTTSGVLHVPAALNDGTELNESLAGTAVRTGNTVRFTQTGDTFVQDLTFNISGNTLTSNQTLSGTTYSVVLTRQ